MEAGNGSVKQPGPGQVAFARRLGLKKLRRYQDARALRRAMKLVKIIRKREQQARERKSARRPHGQIDSGVQREPAGKPRSEPRGFRFREEWHR